MQGNEWGTVRKVRKRYCSSRSPRAFPDGVYGISNLPTNVCEGPHVKDHVLRTACDIKLGRVVSDVIEEWLVTP